MHKPVKIEISNRKYKIYSDGDGFTTVSEDLKVSFHKKSIYDLCGAIFAEEQKHAKETGVEEQFVLTQNELLMNVLKSFSKA